MNRYPRWKNILIIVALFWGLFYTLPNFFGKAPAVQISSAKSTVEIDPVRDSARVERALTEAGIVHNGIFSDAAAIRVRFKNDGSQERAQIIIESAFNPDKKAPSYTVAPNLLPNSPQWFSALNALPMNLGLDLRGGVHFLLEVDMPSAITRQMDSFYGDLNRQLSGRDGKPRPASIARENDTIVLRFQEATQRAAASKAIQSFSNELQLLERDGGDGNLQLVASLTPQAEQRIRDFAIKQNINTLNNRINALGVSEPVIRQQGANRIIVQLPGIQDVAEAKDILGRTATLELRMVVGTPGDETAFAVHQGRMRLPLDTELYFEHRRSSRTKGAEDANDVGLPILIRKWVELTGENLTDAQAGVDENNMPAVHLTLDGVGARKFRELTRRNVGKNMAILLVEKGVGEVVTAPVIRTEIGGGRVQISGSMTSSEAAKTALLLRAGALAAPMEIIEERIVGPSLGEANIQKGSLSTLWGFVAIAVFMMVYYRFFGLISSIALTANLLLLVALLSLLQATLTLPGIAAMALTLGMAIDSNVLINERIREELRNGCTPQIAITAGYERAWATILDSNVTTLIAGIALLAFGSGPVRGFAVVHCLGIFTSMFSAILVSRMLVNFIYGRRRKLEAISIGQVWKPDNN
ncbi:MAG: protein translocase subunit SecD [Betaproteobacteria bacterium]|nr:protein translocase subunit SecD [Betaproteobacteria bacterium]